MERFRLVEEGWRFYDTRLDCFPPWYTQKCLDWLGSRDLNGNNIFEFGSGDSSNWYWRVSHRWPDGVESNLDWVKSPHVLYTQDKDEYISAVLKKGEKHYDFIIIDGIYRDECTENALKAIKEGGYIIIDNYHQATCDMPASYWVNTDKLLEKYPRVVFPQEGHDDWKTAVWQII